MKKILTTVFSVGGFLSLFSVYGMQEERQNGERRWSSEIYDTSGDEFRESQYDSSSSYYLTFPEDSYTSDDEFSESQDDNSFSYYPTFPEDSYSEHDYLSSYLEPIKARLQSTLNEISAMMNSDSDELDKIDQRFENGEINEDECDSQKYDLRKNTKAAVHAKIKEECENFNRLLSSSDGDKKNSLINAFRQYVDDIVKLGFFRLDVNETLAKSGVSFRHIGVSVLDLYCVFVASMYLDSIDDHINLIKSTAKFQHNLEKFFYNPVPLTAQTREFFPRLRALHLYFENDDEFRDDERIKARVYWHPVDHRVLQDNAKEFKKLVMSKAFIEDSLNMYAPEIKKEDWPVCLRNVCLEDGAFKDFGGLQYIELPDYVTELGDKCFENRCRLSKIVLPTRLVGIQPRCFQYCSNLKSIDLPDSVSKIGYDCFAYCSSLTNIEFSKSLGILPRYCFSYCGLQGQLIIPDTIFEIEQYCFQKCTKLQSIVLPTSITMLNCGVFAECDNLVEVFLPSTLKGIQESCFRDCYSLTHIRLPQHMTEVRGSAFSGCGDLTVINQSPLPLKADELGCKKVENLGGVQLKSLQTENLAAIQEAIPTLARLTSLSTLASIPGLAPLSSLGSLENLRHVNQLSEIDEYGLNEIRQTLPELAQLSVLSTLSSIPGLSDLNMLSDLSSLSSLKKK